MRGFCFSWSYWSCWCTWSRVVAGSRVARSRAAGVAGSSWGSWGRWACCSPHGILARGSGHCCQHFSIVHCSGGLCCRVPGQQQVPRQVIGTPSEAQLLDHPFQQSPQQADLLPLTVPWRSLPCSVVLRPHSSGASGVRSKLKSVYALKSELIVVIMLIDDCCLSLRSIMWSGVKADSAYYLSLTPAQFPAGGGEMWHSKGAMI